MGRGKDWSYVEVRQLRLLRQAGKSVKDIARMLGRSGASVRQAAHRHRVVTQEKMTRAEAARVVALARAGRTDAWIALELGVTQRTVRWHRSRAGVPAPALAKRRANRARCFNCNRLAPIAAGKDWAARCGWSSAVVRDSGLDHHVCHCPDCQELLRSSRGLAS